MKNKNKIYLVIIVLGLFVAYKYAGLNVVKNNILPKEKLPKEFVSYQNLSQIKSFNNHTVEPLIKSLFYKRSFEIFEVPENKIVVRVITDSHNIDHGGGYDEDIFTNTLLKLDKTGSVIDTISYKTSSSNQSDLGNMDLINNQLVNQDLLYYYKGSPFERNKTKIDFIPINKNLVWDNDKITTYLDSIANHCKYMQSYYCWRDRSIPYDKRSSITFLMNNKWYVLYGTNDHFDEYSIKETFKVNNESSSDAIPFYHFPNNKVKFRYYQKVKYGSNVMGSHNGSESYVYYFWYGTAFFNCIIGKDTLKFKKEKVYLSDYDTSNKSIYDTIEDKQKILRELAKPYDFYTNSNIKFSLILYNTDLYIIKNKK
jgi:hypothetical protein